MNGKLVKQSHFQGRVFPRGFTVERLSFSDEYVFLIEKQDITMNLEKRGNDYKSQSLHYYVHYCLMYMFLNMINNI